MRKKDARKSMNKKDYKDEDKKKKNITKQKTYDRSSYTKCQKLLQKMGMTPTYFRKTGSNKLNGIKDDQGTLCLWTVQKKSNLQRS